MELPEANGLVWTMSHNRRYRDENENAPDSL